jgi:hypothetical protein
MSTKFRLDFLDKKSILSICLLSRSSAPALHCSPRSPTRADPPGVSAEVLASRWSTSLTLDDRLWGKTAMVDFKVGAAIFFPKGASACFRSAHILSLLHVSLVAAGYSEQCSNWLGLTPFSCIAHDHADDDGCLVKYSGVPGGHFSHNCHSNDTCTTPTTSSTKFWTSGFIWLHNRVTVILFGAQPV